MFDAAWYDDKFARADQFFMIAKFHAQPTGHHQEHFVFVIVMMPHKFPTKLDGLNVTVVDFAEFAVKPVQQFSEAFAVPRHQFREKERGNRGVAFRQIQAGADTTAFFAANQYILFEHQLADVLESNGNFMKLAAKLGSEFVD